MKIRFTIETISQNGSRNASSQDFEKNEVILGRGTGCDILLSSRYVSLRHAKIALIDGKVEIEDLGSPSGTLVNRTPTTRSVLGEGDAITLGDISIEVGISREYVELLYRKKEAEQLDLDAKVARDHKLLQVSSYLPSMRTLSIALCAAALAVFFFLPLFTSGKKSWSSGPIAAPHKMIEHDCQRCHSGNFSRVADENCTACHSMTEHSNIFKAHAGFEPRCAECHMDHNGDHGLIVQDSRLCISCHSELGAVLEPLGKKPQVQNVVSFDQHPQFMVTLQSEVPGGVGKRVSLDDKRALRDVSNIKLNHKVHLEANIRTKTGRKTLDCKYCHEMADDFSTIKPIEFDKHCTECHGLEFDQRLEGVEVPHGDPNVVYRFLYSEYAKLLLSSEASSPTKKSFIARGGRIPGKSAVSEEETRAPDDFSRKFVEDQSRGAEKILFTKTACYLCHAVSENRISESEVRDKGLSRFKVLEPQIPERWMPASTFSHGAHEEVTCVGCHEGVRESVLTADVLLPKIEDCRNCHSGHAGDGKVSGDCITCHSYHDSQEMPADKKKSISELIRQ